MDNSFPQPFTKEAELALLCSQMKPNSEILGRINQIAMENIDWQLFKQIIAQNRLYTITYHNLKANENIPSTYLTDLKHQLIIRGSFNFFASTFLVRILDMFHNNGISVLPFKGPALSEQIYGDLTIRYFSDLDILVHKSNTLSAYNILLKQGFTPQMQLKNDQFKKYIEDEDHFAFYDKNKKISVELHWDISGLYLTRSILFHDLEKYMTTGFLDGNEILYLSPEALLVYLCIHGCKDGWDYLERICSINELIQSNRDIDWQQVYNIALDWRCKKMLQFGLYLSDSLFKTPIPEDLRLVKKKEQKLLNIANQIRNSFFIFKENPEGNMINRFSLFHLYIRDSLRDQIQYFFRLIFRPTDKEWFFFPLPAKISFFHYLIRPCRLFISKLRGDHA